MAIPVLFAARSFAVVDKPAGLAVEADGVDLVKLLARQLAPPGGRAWPRVVHRLDTDTSGCLLVALNGKAEAALLASFDRGAIEKEYQALVAGAPPDAGSCDTPYGPDPADKRRFTTRLETPRRARLSFRVEERFSAAEGAAALLRVQLDTGRTHQIRVQLAESGAPVLGDSTYAPGLAPWAARLGLQRQALHAARLKLPNPETGAPLECLAPLPAELQACLQQLRQGGA